jgi:hypothetical protein
MDPDLFNIIMFVGVFVVLPVMMPPIFYVYTKWFHYWADKD